MQPEWKKGKSPFKILSGKPTGKKPLRRPRRRLNKIKMDLKEIDINTRNWVDSDQDRINWRAVVNAALIHEVSYYQKIDFSTTIGLVMQVERYSVLFLEYLCQRADRAGNDIYRQYETWRHV